MSLFSQFDCFLLDMDGVLWLSDTPIESGVSFANRIIEEGKQRLFLTNNSKLLRESYREKLTGIGIAGVTVEEIITSGFATAAWLRRERSLEGATAFVMGGDGLKTEIASTGVVLIEPEEAVGSTFVIVGWDTELSFERLRAAALAIRAGSEFIASNDDATYPTPDGLWPGAGAIVAAVTTASGRRPVTIGKPHPEMMEMALSVSGCARERTLVIGDRLETDILGGLNAGLKTLLVLTGVATREDVAESSIRPDIVVDDLSSLSAGA
ncbi:MAG: HAD-IIA family hydrolase [Candidatus Geothermincolia bacterium]